MIGSQSCAICALRPIPEDILPQLPRAGFGQLRHHFHFARDHELADIALVARPVDHLRALQLFALLDGHIGLGSFTPVGVGDGHHTGFKDVGVRDQHGFEGDRGDVFATCSDVSVSVLKTD